MNRNHAYGVTAVRNRDTSKENIFVGMLSVRSGRTAVSDSDVIYTTDRLNDRLYGDRGLVSLLAYKKRQFACPSSRCSGRDRETLARLQADIDNLTEDVRIISRLAVLYGNEARRRDLSVAVMDTERTITIPVMVR